MDNHAVNNSNSVSSPRTPALAGPTESDFPLRLARSNTPRTGSRRSQRSPGSDHASREQRDAIIASTITQNIVRIKARRLCRERGFTLDEAPDIEQEIMLELCRKAGQYQPSRATLAAFVTTVTTSCVGMFRRRRQAKRRLPDAPVFHSDTTDDHGREVLGGAWRDRRRQYRPATPLETLFEQDIFALVVHGLSHDDLLFLLEVIESGSTWVARVRTMSRSRVERRRDRLLHQLRASRPELA